MLFHPADVPRWDCVDGDGSLSFPDAVSIDCDGCVGETEPGSSSSVPLGAVIGGSVVGAALLLIAAVFVAKRRRGGKTNGKPGGPASGARKVPVAHDNPVAKNYPIVSDFGGRNYLEDVSGGGGGENPAAAADGRGRNYPVPSDGLDRNYPVVPAV